MQKHLLAILGSPRRHGRIAEMLQSAVSAAEKAGYITETYDLYNKNIGYCTGCMACRRDGICRINDDLPELREKLLSCDMAVLAAPTYFANVPATVKNLFDRLSGAVMDDNNGLIPKPRLKRSQRYLLLTACTTPAPFDRLAGQSSGCLRAMNEFFSAGGMSCAGKIACAGTRNLNKLPSKVKRRIERVFK
ncbi:flavodoxin family protein [Acetanaerobacterium elongatum]|uniref:NADPH-dependent FMN reductase n=1 Tax=Acetanaerobacterium elongatum TaxID=258515 RepID=A0A1G9TYX5_9FIRM|nr:flavodoxin family protein [Acetanaerobacterium elongatum]SDM52465.1 NADPH-dependent FMN reductase [Acetanaerobacterium elongatum]